MTETQLDNARAAVAPRLKHRPTVGLILGSGLGVLADDVRDPVAVAYEEIPDFPVSTVEGHAGRFVFGELGGVQVAAMQGRFHYYEGYSLQEVAAPVWLMRSLGVQTLIVTNAAGAVNTSYQAGDLMLISDHIKLFVDSPLRGPNRAALGPRFNDMSAPYSPSLREVARGRAEALGLSLREGVYAHMGGPSFETPAEIRMLRTLGADAVGMSTVPEVIAASHAGMAVLGISAISNMAAGILDQPLNHEEVMEAGRQIRDRFAQLIASVLEAL